MALRNVVVTDANGNTKRVQVYHNGKLCDVKLYMPSRYDVSDYEYTLNNENLVLTKYIGTNNAVDVKKAEI